MDKKTLMEFGLRALREQIDYSGRPPGSRIYDALKSLNIKIPQIKNPFGPKPTKQGAMRAAMNHAATTPSGKGLLGPNQGYANLGNAKASLVKAKYLPRKDGSTGPLRKY